MVSTAKPQNSAIDLMKFVCALLVVGIHTEPFSFSSVLDNAFGFVNRIAVPFFFIASSYFFFMKSLNFHRLGHYVKRIFILYAIWFIIYICFDWLYLSTPVNSQTFFDFFIYGFQHFWYLQATIIAICLYVGLLHLSKSTRIVYAIA